MEIEKFETIKIWIRKVCGSKITEKNYLRRLEKFFEHYNVTPNELVEKWKGVRYNWTQREKFVDEWSEKIERYYALLDYAPLAKISEVTPVKSFFKHCRIPVEVQLQKHAHVLYHNRNLSKEEIRRILDHSGLREKSFFLMMLESGLRPSTLVQLKYRDIREDFENGTVPMKINLRPEIVKDRVANRFTFIGIDGFNSLSEYLSTRNLGDDDYVFHKKHNRYGTGHLCTEAFSSYFGRLVTKLKLRDISNGRGKPRRVRLYNLRKYFRRNMKCYDTNYQEFWMCHSFGSDEHYISRNVEEHRQQYSEGYKHLRIYESNQESTKETVWLLAKELDETKRKLSKFESIFNDGTLVVTKARLNDLLSKGTSKGQILDMIVSERNEQL